jgi:hypothetical protein
VPDRRKHRGQHPADRELFREEAWPILRQAVADLSWLLTRGYSDNAALKLVGDRFELRERQRKAVLQSSCPEQSLERRQKTQLRANELRGQVLYLDGFNVLTTIESALAGGIIPVGRDGCYRDLASMHGNYRKVQETERAVDLIGQVIAGTDASAARWYLDKPVSNSGRLAQLIRAFGSQNGWNWEAELVNDPDAVLATADGVVCSADSQVLDRCARWFNLAAEVVSRHVPSASVVRLG